MFLSARGHGSGHRQGQDKCKQSRLKQHSVHSSDLLANRVIARFPNRARSLWGAADCPKRDPARGQRFPAPSEQAGNRLCHRKLILVTLELPCCQSQNCRTGHFVACSPSLSAITIWPRNASKYFSTGSSSEILPSSTSIRTAVSFRISYAKSMRNACHGWNRE